MELVTDHLPEIVDLLKELGLDHLTEKFYAAGPTLLECAALCSVFVLAVWRGGPRVVFFFFV